MAKNRVQCSLIVSDNNVYDNLVLPTRANKQLNTLVVQLLNAYYYDETVRKVVDEGVFEDADSSSERRKEVYASINETLMTMDFLAQEGRNMIDDETDLINGIFKAAEDFGMAERVSEDVGESYMRFNPKLLTAGVDNSAGDLMPETQAGVHSDDSAFEARLNTIENAVDRIMKMLQGMQGDSVSGTSAESVTYVEEEAVEIQSEDDSVGTADDDMAQFLAALS